MVKAMDEEKQMCLCVSERERERERAKDVGSTDRRVPFWQCPNELEECLRQSANMPQRAHGYGTVL